MSDAFIVIYFFFYFVLSIKRLDWAIMLMLATLPAYQIRFSVFGYPSTLLEAMILVATIVWAWKNYGQIINNAKLKFKSLNNSSFVIRHSSFTRYPFDVEIVLMLLISWIAIITAGVTNEALGVWKAYFFEPALAFILVMNVFKNPRINESSTNLQITNSIEKILWPLTISAFVISLIAIFQKLTGLFTVAAFWPRVTGPFPYPNALGLYLGPLILIMAGWLFARGKNFQFSVFSFQSILKFFNFQNTLIAISWFLSFIAIFFARSEGALAGVAFALLFFLGFVAVGKAIKSRTVMRIGLIKLFVIMALALAFPLIALKVVPLYHHPHAGNKIVDYALSKVMLRDLSGEIRKQQWRETWQMMTESPSRFLLGAGLSGYQAAVKPYHQEGIFFNRERDPDFRRKIVLFDEKYKAAHWQPVEIYMYPHNFLLNFWTELGLAGVLLTVWIIGKYFVLIISNLKSQISNQVQNQNSKTQTPYFNTIYLNLGLIGAMIVIIVHGVVDVPYFKNDLAVMFWVFIAIAGIMRPGIEEQKA